MALHVLGDSGGRPRPDCPVPWRMIQVLGGGRYHVASGRPFNDRFHIAFAVQSSPAERFLGKAAATLPIGSDQHTRLWRVRPAGPTYPPDIFDYIYMIILWTTRLRHGSAPAAPYLLVVSSLDVSKVITRAIPARIRPRNLKNRDYLSDNLIISKNMPILVKPYNEKP